MSMSASALRCLRRLGLSLFLFQRGVRFIFGVWFRSVHLEDCFRFVLGLFLWQAAVFFVILSCRIVVLFVFHLAKDPPCLATARSYIKVLRDKF